MPYTYTTAPRPVPLARSLATPKTHTPGSRLQERGHRFYNPGLGRWVSRDPIGELGFMVLRDSSEAGSDVWRQGGREGLYVFVRNRMPNTIDPLGLQVLDRGACDDWPVDKPCCVKECRIRGRLEGLRVVATTPDYPFMYEATSLFRITAHSGDCLHMRWFWWTCTKGPRPDPPPWQRAHCRTTSSNVCPSWLEVYGSHVCIVKVKFEYLSCEGGKWKAHEIEDKGHWNFFYPDRGRAHVDWNNAEFWPDS